MRDSIQKPLCSSSTSTDTGAAADDLRINSALSSRFSALSETAVLIRPGQNADETPQLLDKLYAHISWHLMPLFLAIMVLNHVDRTNLAYASITMNADLHIGPAAYGLGSALFFIPFCFCQIPSNLVVARVGARRWLAFLLLGWGTVAACMSLIHNVASFFALRVLLGFFEAGAVPAMWLHLATFFPADRVTKPFALLTIGILVAQAVSGPVAAAFLAMNGLGGLHGWQWLFLLEGLPTVVLSGVVWFWLPDCPSSVSWLTEGDKKLHESSMVESAKTSMLSPHNVTLVSAHGSAHRSQQQHLQEHGVAKLLLSAVCNPWLIALCLLGVLLASASNTYVFFLPMIINALLNGTNKLAAPVAGSGGHGNVSKLLPVVLTCIPYTLAAIVCWCVAHSSQKRQELYLHTAIPAFIGGVAFVLFPFLSRLSMVGGFVCLVFVAVSGASAIGPKTAIVHQITAGPAQVVGMPLYNSIVVLGGFAGPFITGQVVQKTGSFAGISVLFGIILIVFGIFITAMKYIVRNHARKRADMLATTRVGSDSSAGPAAAATVVDVRGPQGAVAGAGMQNAASGGGIVVQPESAVRPRVAAGAGSDKV